MAKAKLVEKIPDPTAGTVAFKYEDGESDVFDINRCSDEVQAWLKSHGASQKIGDSYASAGDPDVTGDLTPLQFAKERVRANIAMLYAGDLRASPTGSGGILAEAMSMVNGKPREENAATLADLSEDEKKELRKKKKIAAALGRIKLQRDAARVARLEKLAAEETDADEDEEEGETV